VRLPSGTPLDDPRFAIWADRLTAPLDSAVAVIGTDGAFSYVSPSITSLLGFEPHALTGTSYLDLVHEHDLAEVRRSVRMFSPLDRGRRQRVARDLPTTSPRRLGCSANRPVRRTRTIGRSTGSS
jgi:PAS domain-containing protein